MDYNRRSEAEQKAWLNIMKAFFEDISKRQTSSSSSNSSFKFMSTVDSNCDCSGCSTMKEFQNLFGRADESALEGYQAPNQDFYDFPDRYELFMELPGVHKGDIDIKFRESNLIIKANRFSIRDDKSRVPLNLPGVPASCNFGRTIKLKEPVNVEGIITSYENGMLYMVIPKTKPEPAKEIRIPL